MSSLKTDLKALTDDQLATLLDDDALQKRLDHIGAPPESTYDLVRTPGVIAEEVEEAGLPGFCTYDENGALESVMYDRLPLLLIPIVKDLVNEVAELKEQINARKT